jgi:hypothetical protein
VSIDEEKHVSLGERDLGPLHITERGAIVRERLLIGAICLIQAVAVISCRNISEPIRFYGHSFSYRIGFSGYAIDPGGGIGSFLWTTTDETSTSYKWRLHDGPGAWVDHPDTPATLTLDHAASLTGPFSEGTLYDFVPYGKDLDGDLYYGRMVAISISMGDWFWSEEE